MCAGTCGEPGPMCPRQSLRRQLRKQRQAIDRHSRARAARAIARQLARCPTLRRSMHLAVYAAIGSELSLAPFMQLASDRGKRVYLPRIEPRGMNFLPQGASLRRNRHGIGEPAHGRRRPPWAMDLILVPLLGADLKGNRLGQGGGYYDRWLARLRFRRPTVLGIAFDCQIVAQLPTEPWDIPLDGLITPTRSYFFRTSTWPTG